MSKILVVEDDQNMRDNIVEILEAGEYQVVSAVNGEDALEQIRNDTIDLVMLDIAMPGMSGMDVLPVIKKEYPATRVIMVTAFSNVETAVEAMRNGADDYVTKPFKIHELLISVNKCLEQIKFADSKLFLNMDDTFSCLANPIRREVLLLINSRKKIRLMDLCRSLEIDDHTKVNFHLRVLKEARLIKQDSQKNYLLSKEGNKVIDCFKTVVKGLGGA